MQHPRMVFLKGNHEEMFVERLGTTWYHYDFDSTKSDFDTLTEEQKQETIRFIDDAPYCAVVGKFILVHAGIDTSIPFEDVYSFLESQDPEFVTWAREQFYLEKGIPGYTIIFGHTVTSELDSSSKGRIWHGKDKIGIDCGCPFYGVLGCLCLDDMSEYYVYDKYTKIKEEERIL